MSRLANKNILITGGNSGIGLAAAQEYSTERALARRHLQGLRIEKYRLEGAGVSKRRFGAEVPQKSCSVRAGWMRVSNLADLDAMVRQCCTIKREFGHLDGILQSVMQVTANLHAVRRGDGAKLRLQEDRLQPSGGLTSQFKRRCRY